jgi:hypothetical protein
VHPLRLPPRSPNLNAYAERFVGSIRRECLNRFITQPTITSSGTIRALATS